MKIPKNKALRFVLAAVLASVMLSTGCQESDEDQGDNTILSTVDSSAPENPSILINNGDATTDSTQVVLNLSAIDDIGVIAIYLSEDDTVPSAAVAGWISVSAAIEFSGTVSFVLSGGDGEKTVYAWFRDAAGNVSAGASDSIALVSESVETCGVPEKNEYVYNLMQDVYLWYDRMPNVDYTDYASPELLLDALRYEDLDRWSYIAEKAEYDRYFNEGQTIGMGIGYRYDGTYLWIRYVLNDSPADLAGLSRGDRILEINGKTLQEIIDQSIENINLGPDEEDVIVNLVVEDVSGDTENIAVTKSLITIDTVLQSSVMERAGKKIGYLVFMQFLETSSAELETAFDTFKAEGVTELVLDLRYNGGGRISVANYLAKLIAGNRVLSTDIFVRYLHNDKISSWNSNAAFGTIPANALDLDRVVVVTTRGTASASELVINSLKPFLSEIVLVGDTTHGKPVGMYSWTFCDMVVVPISFQTQNADWQGEYFGGFVPTCYADDELTQTFGNQEEDSLQEALYYLENDTCSPVGTIQTSPKVGKKAGQSLPESGLRKMMGMM